MGRALQPILVHRIELAGIPVPPDSGPSHQRDVVIVNDVEVPAQNLPNGAGVEYGKPRLVGHKRRECAPGGPESVNLHAGVVPQLLRLGSPRKSLVGIDAVDDLHFVSAGSQLGGEVVDEETVASEVVGRVEGGNQAEAQQRASTHDPSRCGPGK
jgi:hypothetical protein